MSDKDKEDHANNFANAVCHEDVDPNTTSVKGFQREEIVRSISRSYKGAKADLDRVDKGVKPLKPFVNDKDLSFWRDCIEETDKCIAGKYKTESVSSIFKCNKNTILHSNASKR